MIAKATQPENAESLGFSDTVHISYWNYWLLLLFIMGIQTAHSVADRRICISDSATVIVLELFLCASILLGFIFGPKIYMMLSYEPAVVEMRPQKIVKDFVNFWKSLELRKSHTHSTCSVVNCKNSSTYTRANCRIPIFYIVMRRNNHLERSHSADRKSCGRIIEQITMPSEMLCHDKKKENGDQFHKHGTYI
uniref:Uncharacterized protein n=1 Tax=Wuchereria bancrofti TaxID=6293 RepID=A0A1I8EKA0_WUCBA